MLRQALVAIGFALVITVLAGAGLYFYQLPTTLVLAVGPQDSDDERLVSGIAQKLVVDNAAVRLKIQVRNSPATAAAAIDKGEADLAVIRSDLAIPAAARAVAIFHRNVVSLMALSTSKVKRVSDLVGKTIGVIGHPGMNEGLLDIILQNQNVALSAVRVITLQPSEVREAVRTRRIDALLALGPQSGRAATEALSAFSQAGRAPVFLPIENAAGIAKRTLAYEEAEIVAGSFGGNRPAQSVTTIGFQNYLVARQTVREAVVTEFTRLLFNLRPSLAIDFAGANQIEAPDTKKDARLLVHPGAAAYFDGEERSFFDVYGDWFYYGLFVFGMLGSAFTWMMRMLTPAGRVSNSQMFEQLVGMLPRARRAASDGELNELESQADEVFANAMGKAEAEALDETQLMTFSLALEYLRQAISDRRRSVSHELPETEAPAVSAVPDLVTASATRFRPREVRASDGKIDISPSREMPSDQPMPTSTQTRATMDLASGNS